MSDTLHFYQARSREGAGVVFIYHATNYEMTENLRLLGAFTPNQAEILGKGLLDVTSGVRKDADLSSEEYEKRIERTRTMISYMKAKRVLV